MIALTLMPYLGRGVTTASILRDGADMARRNHAPVAIVERIGCAAAVVAAGEPYPQWARPVEDEKRASYVVERQQEEAGT